METHNSVCAVSPWFYITLTDLVGCWITSDYPVQRIVLEYMWMWITCFINFIFYIPMALVLVFDRTVVIHGWRIHLTPNNRHKHHRVEERSLALKMLVYPAVYTITVCSLLHLVSTYI